MIYEVIYEGTGTTKVVGKATEELKDLQKSDRENAKS